VFPLLCESDNPLNLLNEVPDGKAPTNNHWEECLMVNFPPPYEELLPELQEYLEDDGVMPMIRHPLVFSVPHNDLFNAHMNKALKSKQALLQRAKDEKDWNRYIFLHERPYRLFALNRAILEQGGLKISSLEFCEALRDVWIDTEFPTDQNLAWCSLLGFACLDPYPNQLESPHRVATGMMTAEELDWLYQAPDVLTIYRGFTQVENPHGEFEDDGLSWTLDYEKAKWFARRFVKQNVNEDGTLKWFARDSENEIPYVAHATISKEDIIAYITARGESEIIIFPSYSSDLMTGFYQGAYGAVGRQIIEKVQAQWRFEIMSRQLSRRQLGGRADSFKLSHVEEVGYGN